MKFFKPVVMPFCAVPSLIFHKPSNEVGILTKSSFSLFSSSVVLILYYRSHTAAPPKLLLGIMKNKLRQYWRFTINLNFMWLRGFHVILCDFYGFHVILSVSCDFLWFYEGLLLTWVLCDFIGFMCFMWLFIHLKIKKN